MSATAGAAGGRLEVALETSSLRPSVAVRVAGRIESRTLAGDRPHASDLLPALEHLLAGFEASPRDITAVLVGTGPGSYTGLRVGIATALGLVRGTGAALFGVPSLEALAYGELAQGSAAAFLLDARQGELYLARYRREEEGVAVLQPPCVTTPAELGRLLQPDEPVYADGAALPRAAALLELGARRLAREGPHVAEDVEPLYLRAFAVRSRLPRTRSGP
jgi:tRNA threonylcarbamoyladenosine biosynthesis protein TsaB